MGEYNKSNGVGNLVFGANVTALGAIVGAQLGLVGPPTPATNVFAFSTVGHGNVDPLDVSLQACVTGAAAGVAVVSKTTDTNFVVATYTAAGASTALPFAVMGRRRYGGGRYVRGPIGNLALSVVYDVIATVPTAVGPQRGVASIVRTGAGVFEITLADQIDPLNAIPWVGPADASGGSIDSTVTCEHVSDSLFRVRTFDGGTPTDRAFSAELVRVAVGAAA